MIGPCAKRRVIATLVTPGDLCFTAENICGNAQTVCPREPGEGYAKCLTVCEQNDHAEALAIRRGLSLVGREGIRGGRLFVHHHYACKSCAALAAKYDLELVFTAPADSERTPDQ